MTKPRLTPWFPADVKPVHVGVYETRMSIAEEGPYYNKWDGCDWLGSATTQEVAESIGMISSISRLSWRGLAEKTV